MIRTTAITTLLFLLAACNGQHSSFTPPISIQEPLPDSCYTRKAVFAIVDTTEAFRRIDEGLYFGKIALPDARLMRAQVWQNNNIPYIGYKYIMQYINDDSVQLVPQRRMMYYDYVMRATGINGSTLAIRYAKEMVKSAHELGRKDREAYGDFMVAYYQYIAANYQNNESIIHSMSQALNKLLESHTDEQILVIHCFSFLQNALLEHNMSDSLLSVCLKEEAYLKTVPKTRFYEACYPILYGNMAKAYIGLGDTLSAKAAYEKWKQTSMASTNLGKASIFSYLIRTSWGVADGIAMAPDVIAFFKDSDLDQYANTFVELAWVYSQRHDYLTAYNYLQKADSIRTVISKNELNKESQKWAKQYELQKKDFEIEQERTHKRMAWIITSFVVIILIGVIIAFLYYVHTSRQTKQKNRKLTKQLEQIERYRTEVSQLRVSALHRKDAKNAADAISDAELYEKMEKVTNEQTLYMIPKYPLPDMARQLEVSQARLLTFFRNSPDFGNLDDYLDMKRVVKACQILRTQPGQSMQAVSDLSGFTNTRQFNRKFKEAMSMTPSEYKLTN